jgi:predicted AlkP superfamily pyrophosphatase or phosphodiesterase
MKSFILFMFVVSASFSHALNFLKYTKKPKLIVVLVIDQFRADYLSRFQKEFVPATNKNEVGGFNYLMSKGAYFPAAEYDVLQSMTCPGHAMIATGSHPYYTGISLNDWYDVETRKKTYCAEDAEFGVSPRRLKTSTFGDELKNISEGSKVISVALKDRSSIMLGGHRSDLSLWMDFNDYKWVTSAFYRKDIPAWAQFENEAIAKAGLLKKGSKESMKNIITPYATEITRSMAEAALKNEKLGKSGKTDILAVSFSAHDMAGHTFGPNAAEMKAMTISEDKEIAKLLNAIKKQLGSLNDVVIALTADHGVAPTVDVSKTNKMEAEQIDYLGMYKKIYARLDDKFGKPSKEWILAGMSFNFYLNPDALKERKVTAEQVETEVKDVVKDAPGIFQVATQSEIAKGIVPIGETGMQTARQFIPGENGNIILIPKPYHISKAEALANHVTGYAYDRTVPLIIMGPNIKAGVYSSQAKVIDLAPTLSFINGALPPATTTGRILNEIFE